MTSSLSLLYAPATKVTKVTLASEAHHHMIFIRLADGGVDGGR